MFVNFNQLPFHARVWIYLASAKLSKNEIEVVSRMAQSFCEQWQTHGQPLTASFKIFLDQFLVLAVDEANSSISGCAIDSAVRMLKDFQTMGINFLDSSKIPFLIQDEIHLITRKDIPEKLSANVINATTTTFNSLTSTKGEMDNQWMIPMSKSWMSKYIN